MCAHIMLNHTNARHEMPSEGDMALSQQNIQDRYHGKNDPVALKLLGRIQGKPSSLQPPEDKTIVSKYDV